MTADRDDRFTGGDPLRFRFEDDTPRQVMPVPPEWAHRKIARPEPVQKPTEYERQQRRYGVIEGREYRTPSQIEMASQVAARVRVEETKDRISVATRFWTKVDPCRTDGCWVWLGGQNGFGYGYFWDGQNYVRAHRWSFEMVKGPIPEGLVIDHLCRNKPCVNPDHLEAVTQAVNTYRGVSFAAINAKKTHCPQGHEYTPENTLIRNGGRRYCRICEADHSHRAWERRLAKRIWERVRVEVCDASTKDSAGVLPALRATSPDGTDAGSSLEHCSPASRPALSVRDCAAAPASATSALDRPGDDELLDADAGRWADMLAEERDSAAESALGRLTL